MSYHTSTDRRALNELNSRGLPRGGDTVRWFPVHKHPDRDEWALEIPDRAREIVGKILSEREKITLLPVMKTDKEFEDGGWLKKAPTGNQTRT